MTYGYRYRPGSRVFELPGLGPDQAHAEVERCRTAQRKYGGTATVELVQHTPDGWHPVPESAHTQENP
ncbi:hypothetical protein [Nocardia sp. A7]|uniref:hypothetical protein n=1 Tax=Nocardia sp. A7 TaxID=2789274 RepID=UPI003979ECD3